MSLITDLYIFSKKNHSQAGCTPFASSLIADYFGQEVRGTALGVYNLGIYMGYSMSYAFGDFITQADILGKASAHLFQ